MIPYTPASSPVRLLAAPTRLQGRRCNSTSAILCGLRVLAKGIVGLGLPLMSSCLMAFTRTGQRGRGVRAAAVWLLVFAPRARRRRRAVATTRCSSGTVCRSGASCSATTLARWSSGQTRFAARFEYFLSELGLRPDCGIDVAPAEVGWSVMRGGARGTAATAARRGRDPPRGVRSTWESSGSARIWFVAFLTLVSAVDDEVPPLRGPAIRARHRDIGCILDDLMRRGPARGRRRRRSSASRLISSCRSRRREELVRRALLVVVLGTTTCTDRTAGPCGPREARLRGTIMLFGRFGRASRYALVSARCGVRARGWRGRRLASRTPARRIHARPSRRTVCRRVDSPFLQEPRVG